MYIKAAKNGLPAGEYNVGRCYLNGKGVKSDDAKAYEWFKKAATHGHSQSMYIIGRYHEEGCVVPKNIEEAHKWYKKFAYSGQGWVNDFKELADKYYHSTRKPILLGDSPLGNLPFGKEKPKIEDFLKTDDGKVMLHCYQVAAYYGDNEAKKRIQELKGYMEEEGE